MTLSYYQNQIIVLQIINKQQKNKKIQHKLYNLIIFPLPNHQSGAQRPCLTKNKQKQMKKPGSRHTATVAAQTAAVATTTATTDNM